MSAKMTTRGFLRQQPPPVSQWGLASGPGRSTPRRFLEGSIARLREGSNPSIRSLREKRQIAHRKLPVIFDECILTSILLPPSSIVASRVLLDGSRVLGRPG
jgi:hypothetical protein